MTPLLHLHAPQTTTQARRSALADDVVSMIRAGHSVSAVAETLGMSVSKVSVLSRGLASRLKVARDAEIVRLRRAGRSHRALATHFGLSVTRILRICARHEAAAA